MFGEISSKTHEAALVVDEVNDGQVEILIPQFVHQGRVTQDHSAVFWKDKDVTFRWNTNKIYINDKLSANGQNIKI